MEWERSDLETQGGRGESNHYHSLSSVLPPRGHSADAKGLEFPAASPLTADARDKRSNRIIRLSWFTSLGSSHNDNRESLIISLETFLPVEGRRPAKMII